MRSTVGIFGAITALLVGFYALSEGAQQVSQDINTTGPGANASAYNTSVDVFNQVGQTAAPGVVWMGISAIVLIGLGFLVVSGSSGR